jgi:hypothetical protein
MGDEKLMPVAVCVKCHEYTHRIEVVNQQCYKQYDNKRCNGTFTSAIGNNDWAKCSACEGSGSDSDGKCEGCQGYGVQFVRR